MKNKENTFRIIMWSICAIIMIALIILVFVDRKRYQERINESIIEAQMQNEDLEKREKERVQKATEIYNELISELPLRSFICWGDAEMRGNDESSLSNELEIILNGNLRSLLEDSFSDVIANENNETPSITVSNMGYANEGMREIMVRAGVNIIQVGEWALIPEEPEPVNLVLQDSETGTDLHFSEDTGFGNVMISDVEGALTTGNGEYDEDHPRLAFVRSESGESFQVNRGTEIEIETASKYIGSVPVFFFGDSTAESEDSVEVFVDEVERLVDRYTDSNNYEGNVSEGDLAYLVVCTAGKNSELIDELRERFGDRYLRNDIHVDEMTEDNYKQLAQLVYDNLNGQGCFDSIRQAIAKAEEEL